VEPLARDTRVLCARAPRSASRRRTDAAARDADLKQSDHDLDRGQPGKPVEFGRLS